MLKVVQDIFSKFDNKKNEVKVQTFMEGKAVSLKKVPDPVFSGKILGEGIAIDPIGDLLFSPVDGTVAALMERTRHSCCIRGRNGVEFLLHIGVNTVEMNGEGFELLVKNGQEVKAGDPLIRFSKEKILAAGHPAISSMMITEMGPYRHAAFQIDKMVKKGDVIAELS